MNSVLAKLAVKYLRDAANKIERGECDMSDDEAGGMIGAVCHRAISKAEACEYLNVSIPTFDNLVRDKRIPKGRKRKGWKELVWYLDEIMIINKR